MYYFIIILTVLYDSFIVSCRFTALLSDFKPEQQETQDLLCIAYDFVIEQHSVLAFLIMLLFSFLSVYMIGKRSLKTPEQYKQLCRKKEKKLTWHLPG